MVKRAPNKDEHVHLHFAVEIAFVLMYDLLFQFLKVVDDLNVFLFLLFQLTYVVSNKMKF